MVHSGYTGTSNPRTPIMSTKPSKETTTRPPLLKRSHIYWQDYESSLLTTFNTPWGRYRFVCLHWGPSCAQGIFQRMMDQTLERCKGIIGIANDVVIYGDDNEDHNRYLHNFMCRAHEHSLVFNGEKCEVKKDLVTLFGTVYDANGAHPDTKKVDAIHKMPSCQGFILGKSVKPCLLASSSSLEITYKHLVMQFKVQNI